MNPLFNPLTGLATAGLLTLAGALTDGSTSKALTLAGAGAAGGSAVAALVGASAVRKEFADILSVDDEVKKRQKRLAQLETQLERFVNESEQQKATANRDLDRLNQDIKKWSSYKSDLNNEIAQLRRKITELEEDKSVVSLLVDAGCVTREYPGLTSAQLGEKLKDNRVNQKAVAKDILARTAETSWMVNNSLAKGRALIKKQATALLRGFNAECDAALATLKHSNETTVLNKIERAWNFYEKKAVDVHVDSWDSQLYYLKLNECKLVHENELQKQIEKEEQAEIRQRMREEERALRELEKAEKEAAAEAKKYAELLEKARQEAQNDEHIAELQRRLDEALANQERALSRAQMTRSGHVYVISNIGSFGDGVYKVGMSRRLEPMDRVRELGDASVPFPFDVHAMIFTEDAPGLENAIHRRIESSRLNRVNLRREFFTISMETLVKEVEAAAADIGVTHEIRWTLLAAAEQYRQSLAEREGEPSPSFATT